VSCPRTALRAHLPRRRRRAVLRRCRAPRTAPRRPTAAELAGTPGALLTTSDLAALGLPRKAIESVLRQVPVVYLDGYRRPLVRAEDYRELVERSLDRGDRVRPA
jgi:hypothetical protein